MDGYTMYSGSFCNRRIVRIPDNNTLRSVRCLFLCLHQAERLFKSPTHNSEPLVNRSILKSEGICRRFESVKLLPIDGKVFCQALPVSRL